MNKLWREKPSFINALLCCTAMNNCLQPTFNFLNNSFISNATHVACPEKSYKCMRTIIKSLTFSSTTRRPINNCSKKHTQYENFYIEAIVHFPSFMRVIGSIRQLLSAPCLSQCIISVTQIFPLKAPNKQIRLLNSLFSRLIRNHTTKASLFWETIAVEWFLPPYFRGNLPILVATKSGQVCILVVSNRCGAS